MIQEVYYALAACGFLITTLLWLTSKFTNLENKLKTAMQEVFDKIIEKLEYHERHDDSRFSELRDSLHGIQLRNASKDVLMDDLRSDLRKITNGKKAFDRSTPGA